MTFFSQLVNKIVPKFELCMPVSFFKKSGMYSFLFAWIIDFLNNRKFSTEACHLVPYELVVAYEVTSLRQLER